MNAPARIGRPFLDYASPAHRAAAHGIDITTPVAGFYRGKMMSGGIRGGIRLWYGPPACPDTGEIMDRSWRWQAEFDGEYVEFDRLWPQCAGDPITEAEYREYVGRARWAREHSPHSAYANPRKRLDPLSTKEALPF